MNQAVQTSDSVSFASMTVTTQFLLPTNAAPRTNVTPSRAGALIHNSAANEICVSTGTTVDSWALLKDTTTVCSN
jgi:hypothetical protein